VREVFDRSEMQVQTGDMAAAQNEPRWLNVRTSRASLSRSRSLWASEVAQIESSGEASVRACPSRLGQHSKRRCIQWRGLATRSWLLYTHTKRLIGLT
jgi:hypothetical protein